MYTHFESSLQDQFRNCYKTMAIGVLKIFSTKISCFTVLYELTKSEFFLSLFIGGGGNFVCGLLDNSFL